MSLLALLATGPGTPLATGVRQKIVAQLNPANYGGRVFTVGTDAATINGCLALADAASSAGNWSLVLIPPGTYAERVRRPAAGSGVYTDVASTTLNPADVILNPPDGTDDTWEARGTGGILAGVTLNGKGAFSALHSGEFGAAYEFIFYKVNATQTGTGNDAFSWGVGPDQKVYAYDCQWNGLAGSRAVYAHTFHGPQPAPGLLLMDGCTITGPTPGTGSAGFQDLGSGQDDRIYIKGGSAPTDWGLALWETDTASWSGAIDPKLTATLGPGVLVNRTLPNPLPTPARLT